jgi:folate-binding protein YgfZ
VSVVDANPEFSQIDLDGQEAKTTLIHLGIDPPRDLHNVVSGIITNVPVIVIGTNGLVGSGYRLLFPDGTRETIKNVLLDSGAIPLTSESYQVLRVEAGLPAAGKELTVEYTPLEAGLSAAISENKGYYTGQEVIARQISYDKVTKHLVGLRLATTVKANERVWADGKPIGFITSCTLSPTYGPIALAYVKRPHNLPRSIVWVNQTKENKGIRAVVTP